MLETLVSNSYLESPHHPSGLDRRRLDSLATLSTVQQPDCFPNSHWLHSWWEGTKLRGELGCPCPLRASILVGQVSQMERIKSDESTGSF